MCAHLGIPIDVIVFDHFCRGRQRRLWRDLLRRNRPSALAGRKATSSNHAKISNARHNDPHRYVEDRTTGTHPYPSGLIQPYIADDRLSIPAAHHGMRPRHLAHSGPSEVRRLPRLWAQTNHFLLHHFQKVADRLDAPVFRF